jgi:hypothetical protein
MNEGKLDLNDLQTWIGFMYNTFQEIETVHQTTESLDEMRDVMTTALGNKLKPAMQQLIESVVKDSRSNMMDKWRDISEKDKVIKNQYSSLRTGILSALDKKFNSIKGQINDRINHPRTSEHNKKSLDEIQKVIGVMRDTAWRALDLTRDVECARMEDEINTIINQAHASMRQKQRDDNFDYKTLDGWISLTTETTSAALARRMVSNAEHFIEAIGDTYNITGITLTKEEILQNVTNVLAESSEANKQTKEKIRVKKEQKTAAEWAAERPIIEEIAPDSMEDFEDDATRRRRAEEARKAKRKSKKAKKRSQRKHSSDDDFQ